jgi:hypothetical protein
VLLAYPDFKAPFQIHTDACKTQIGAVISQNGKPIAFYSRKMNSAQQNYAVTEKELLSIVATLKEFRNILLGQQITVFTDHKNLTYKNFNTERVMRWRLGCWCSKNSAQTYSTLKANAMSSPTLYHD